MSDQPFMPLRDTELGNTALKLSEDRRILLEFVRSCSSGERKEGGYLQSRDQIREKAILILEQLGENE